MIDVHLRVEQDGKEMKTTIAAKTNETSTEEEMQWVGRIVANLQARIVEKGGDASFIERSFDASGDAIPL